MFAELIAAFGRFLFGRGGVPFNAYDLAASVIIVLIGVFLAFRGLKLLSMLGTAVMLPVTDATTAKDRKRDEDFIAANTDRAREATRTYFSGKTSGDWSEFEQVTSQPDPVREPTPASEQLAAGCLPLITLAVVLIVIAGIAGLALKLLGVL